MAKIALPSNVEPEVSFFDIAPGVKFMAKGNGQVVYEIIAINGTVATLRCLGGLRAVEEKGTIERDIFEVILPNVKKIMGPSNNG